MAYAAVVSLEQILKQLLDSDPFPIHYPKSQIESLYGNILSLQNFLEKNFPVSKTNKNAVTDLETQIRDSIYEAEDTIEHYISSKFLGDDEIYILYLNQKLGEVIQAIDSIKEKIEDIWHGIVELQTTQFPPDDAVLKDELTGGSLPAYVTQSINQIMDWVTGSDSRLQIVSIVGMTGIGKSALAKKIYNHQFVQYHFYRCAFVTVGQRSSVRELLLEILVQLTPGHVNTCDDKTDNELQIYKTLKGVRYLIVLDDMWNTQIWNELRRNFPDDRNGSRLIITTTQLQVSAYVSIDGYIHHMPFMNVAESWDLLREMVFAEESCPPELEKIGKTIAQNCQGLPLEIISISRQLSKAEKTVESWKKVGENQNSIVTRGDDMDIFKRLYLSYENLPQHLKACFLYMGLFPQNYEIPASEVLRLWVAEGFLEPKEHTSLEEVGEECLKELVDRSLVIVHEKSSRGRIKTCRVHNLFRLLCATEAEKNKFFHVINGYTGNRFPEGMTGQRRLCIHKNIVFGIKGILEMMASVSNARSLLCIAAHHQYPLPVCLEFKLLRVLDALTIRFYKFPVAILKLVHLRYLALTFNGELPAFISRLGRLQILIVRLHLRIRSSAGSTPSYLPMEIWNMKELRHLQFMGNDLPNPYDVDQLSSLLTLSDVSPQSCTKRILERIRQLKKLGIRIELVPSDLAAEPLCPFDHLALLDQLESFKCVVVNPNFRSQNFKLPDSTSFFPGSLKKITLSGCGFPWVDMKIISQLPYLEVLKLREFAFRGPEWELLEEEFCRLKFLLLESMDLVRWRTDDSHLPCLESLILKHCYQLEEIPLEIGDIGALKLIELVDCCPSVLDSVKEIEEEQKSFGNYYLQVRVYSSPE